DQFRPKTDGGFAVWEDYRNGPDGDVYAYNLESGAEVPVATGAAPQRCPATSDGRVVWEEDRGSGWKIYGYDLASGEYFTVSESPGDKRRPDISGGLVVWENHAGAGLSDIVGKRLGSGGEFSVSGDSTIYEDTPRVSGSTVVWREEGPGNDDVYGRDLESGEEFEVCVDPADQHSPDINGKLAVWTDGRGSSADVFGLDLETGEEFPVAGEGSAEDSPAIGGETVVWEAQRDGETNFGDWDIHAASLDAAPVKPANLSSAGTLGGVSLAWTPNTESDFHHYDVYRRDSDGDFQKINADPLTTPAYTDIEAPKGVVSHYEVRAVDGAGQSSGPASASVAALSNTSLTLAASAPSVGFGGTVDLSGSLVFGSQSGPVPDGEIVLEKSPAGANDFEEVSRGETDSNGAFAFEGVAPVEAADFRASFAGLPASGFEPSVSGTVRVAVVIPATSLTASASPSVVKHGDATKVSGRLVSGGAGVGGRTVILDARPSGAPNFVETKQTRTGSDGRYDFTGLRPKKHTFYRARFAGDAGLKPSVSEAARAQVRAVVSTRLSASRVKVGRAVVVTGAVAPAHSGSVVVTIRGNGRVVAERRASLAATSVAPLSESRYRTSFVPRRAGNYTVVVRFAGDADHLAASGPARSFAAR
nr:hypothetical protein [Rubrobacter sp.]